MTSTKGVTLMSESTSLSLLPPVVIAIATYS
jgi:hypothetical protein